MMNLRDTDDKKKQALKIAINTSWSVLKGIKK